MARNKRSHFALNFGPQTEAELKRLKATPSNIEKVIGDELKTTANVIRNHIIKSMRGTPRITRPKKNSVTGGQGGNYNWIIGGKLHIPSSPGYAPAVASSDLIKSIKMDVRKSGILDQMEVEVGSNLKGKHGKYPIYLEFGTKEMEARPWLEPAYIVGKRLFYAGIRNHVLRAMK